jgi:hypothetical protein
VTEGNQSRNYSKKYTDTAFDILFIYTQNGEKFSIPWGKVIARNELTISDKKYIKYKV